MSPARPRAQDGHLVFEAPALPSGILQGDCLELMPELPAACVDLVLTDPPYVCRYRDRSGRTVANDNRSCGFQINGTSIPVNPGQSFH